ncbi:hypothetical protein N7455_001167 [Penicillium solitum]|uniref:uncharacterized protein n=1 Tax=Penicillium solitum TaxID=60172 RepID=UPI0032C3EF43|nr:hypothetical protein N7455_001167 [Penicillium solitum]
MEDLSKYGFPNADWIQFVIGKALPPFPSHLDTLEIQRRINSEREAVASQQFIDSDFGDKVLFQDYDVNIPDDTLSIPIRLSRPNFRPNTDSIIASLPVYLFFHGGGFLFGSETQDECTCARLAVTHNMIGLNANYRHTPVWTYPTQHEDAWRAFQWLMDNIDVIGGDRLRVVVGGVSAGANLAAYVVRRHQELQRDEEALERPKVCISGLILDMPWLVHPDFYPLSLRSQSHHSYIQCANAPLLPMERVRLFTRLLGPVPEERSSLMRISLDLDDLKNMPPTVVLVAGNDPFRDEGWLFANRLSDAGVQVKGYIFPGMPHAFWKLEELQATSLYRTALEDSFSWLLSEEMSKPEETFQTIGAFGEPTLAT